MIHGVVNSGLEIRVQLPILDGNGVEQMIDAVLDTGFNGAVTLPAALIASLRLPWLTRGQVRFGNGSVEWIEYYKGTIVWDGVHRRVRVQAIDGSPLIGMSLLAGYDLRARVVLGGDVQIEAIP